MFQIVVLKVKQQQREATAVALWADSNLPDRDGHKAQRGHVAYGIHRGSYCGGSQGGYHQCNSKPEFEVHIRLLCGKGPKCESDAATSEPVRLGVWKFFILRISWSFLAIIVMLS